MKNIGARSILAFAIVVVALPSYSQSKYWIEFRDKGISDSSFHAGNRIFDSVYHSLSKECLLRRSEAQHIPQVQTVTIEDVPIYPPYIAAIQKFGISVTGHSKWANAIAADLTKKQVRRISKCPFVYHIVPVAQERALSVQPVASAPVSVAHELHVANDSSAYDPVIYHYGIADSQLTRINVWPLHAMGFDGNGVRLGFLDCGFRWKENDAFQRLHVVGEYDYVFHDSITENQEADTSIQDGHGTETLCTAAGYLPDTVMGPAFGATLMLAKTEDVRSEHHIEEENYAAAIEDMEARGVDITSSSLGYFTFDPPDKSYTYADMNGHTTIVARSLERAAKLGVLCVTAMGNNGADTNNPYVESPADADSIISAGALEIDDRVAAFSARGPTSDGRIKPEVCAPGVQVWAQNRDGGIGPAGGTSFATPLISGACCLIKQAHPEATAQEIRRAVMLTADRASHPDTAYGWGKINAYAAALELGPIVRIKNISLDSVVHFTVAAASNNGVRSVSLLYMGDSDVAPRSLTMALAADSLIYTASLPFGGLGAHVLYRAELIDRSGSGPVLSSAWNSIAIPTSGIELPRSTASTSIFPNPSTSEVLFRSNKPGEWKLLDALGRIVASGTVQEGETSFSVAPFPSGQYHLRFAPQHARVELLPLIIAH